MAAVVISATSAHANCEGNNCIRAMINTKHVPNPTAYCRSYLATTVTSTGTAAYPTDWVNCQGDPFQHITMGRNIDSDQLGPYRMDIIEFYYANYRRNSHWYRGTYQLLDLDTKWHPSDS
ncbi:hypothetical protein CMQ_5457 [Grosmannia clavigera kw1407]|uniref:Uncharacterized protein n=1 Tax=Grosmannia clavigera (strain kw1407 / UAMH 11150) TaxID=655863 RepID=F0XG36_GROCL|nr:uncharacterized protein CMQ_5457 [Grosmannia clavigera kw1407]EFX03407.1 hypothetical protein CMQ_5457 [Grosmannia clavigera kw1407]